VLRHPNGSGRESTPQRRVGDWFLDLLGIFPDRRIEFPVNRKKFPVPSRREMAAQLVDITYALAAGSAYQSARCGDIPCIFPVNREIVAPETGSLVTGCSASLSQWVYDKLG
jgi:hypothetical protein